MRCLPTSVCWVASAAVELFGRDEAAFNEHVAEPAALVRARPLGAAVPRAQALPRAQAARVGAASGEVKIVPEFTSTPSAERDGN